MGNVTHETKNQYYQGFKTTFMPMAEGKIIYLLLVKVIKSTYSHLTRVCFGMKGGFFGGKNFTVISFKQHLPLEDTI